MIGNKLIKDIQFYVEIGSGQEDLKGRNRYKDEHEQEILEDKARDKFNKEFEDFLNAIKIRA